MYALLKNIGSGATCGSYCVIDGGGGGGGKNTVDDILTTEFDGSTNLIMLTVVPVGCIFILMCLFYGANFSVDKKFEKDPALIGYAQDVDETDRYRLSARFSNPQNGRPSSGRLSAGGRLSANGRM